MYFLSVTTKNYVIMRDGKILKNVICLPDNSHNQSNINNLIEGITALSVIVNNEGVGVDNSTIIEARTPILKWIEKGEAPKDFGDEFFKLLEALDSLNSRVSLVHSKNLVAKDLYSHAKSSYDDFIPLKDTFI